MQNANCSHTRLFGGVCIFCLIAAIGSMVVWGGAVAVNDVYTAKIAILVGMMFLLGSVVCMSISVLIFYLWGDSRFEIHQNTNELVYEES